MIDFSREWHRYDSGRQSPKTSAYWNGRATTFTPDVLPTPYTLEFLNKTGLQGNWFAQEPTGEQREVCVFDMGCGAGNLSIPLALNGYQVTSADFSCSMLDILRDESHKRGVDNNVSVRELSWDDDWDQCGLIENQVDIALASRSIMTPDLQGVLEKLSWLARDRVYVTAAAGLSPHVDARIMKVLGLKPARRNDSVYVFGLLDQLGYFPEVSYIDSPRIDAYRSVDDAYERLLPQIRHHNVSLLDAEYEQKCAELRAFLEEDLVPLDITSTNRACIEDIAKLSLSSEELLSTPFYTLSKPRVTKWAFISWKTMR